MYYTIKYGPVPSTNIFSLINCNEVTWLAKAFFSIYILIIIISVNINHVIILNIL